MRPTVRILLFLLSVGMLGACGVEPDTPTLNDRPKSILASTEDSARIDRFYIRTSRMFEEVLALDSTQYGENCRLKLVEGTRVNLLKLDELAAVFSPDTFLGYDYRHIKNLIGVNFVDNMKDQRYRREFGEQVKLIEESGYLVLIEIRKLPYPEVHVDAGYFMGLDFKSIIHLFDYNTEELLCSRAVVCDNSWKVEYSEHDRLSEIESNVHRDLYINANAAITDSINAIFGF